MNTLDETTIRTALEQNDPGWELRDDTLHRTIETGDFATGLRLVDGIGAAAEEAGHHPDVLLTYPSVEITLTSHDAGGVTQEDLALAAAVDRLVHAVVGG